LRELLPIFNKGGYGGLYRHVMEMPQEEVNRLLKPLIDNIAEIYKEAEPEKEDEDFWAAKAAKEFCRNGNIDRGIFSIYLFNLVHLRKGEAIFQDAGVPHAYLEGAGVEIMANSDNVLRGGLTTKHIDVAELLKHTRCEPTQVEILPGETAGSQEKNYSAPVMDFQLSVFELAKGEGAKFSSGTACILILTAGSVNVTDGDATIHLSPGKPAVFVAQGSEVQLDFVEDSTVFRASVPANKG
jgi:mannose-6-phosphate isomerase